MTHFVLEHEDEYGVYIRCFIQSNLPNVVTLEGHILGSFVRNCKRGNIGQSLCLMDDSVGEGQVIPVLKMCLTTSYHPSQFLLDLVWKMKSCLFRWRQFLHIFLFKLWMSEAHYLVFLDTWP